MSRTPSSDAGFTLAALIVIMTIIAIMVAYTVPEQWSMVMARERDKQAIFIMKQYARAIMTYQQRHGGLPTSLDQLKDAKNPRLVRGDGEWEDPLTGKVDWELIPVTAMQPGGQPGQPGFIPGLNRSSGLNQPVNGSQPGSLNRSGNTPQNQTGPFVGVRPGKKGKSFLALNGAESYEDWSYTIQDLQNEINARANSLVQK